MMPARRLGPIEKATTADLKALRLSGDLPPASDGLAALAVSLSRSLDVEQNAAQAKELRIVLTALAARVKPPTDPSWDQFIAHISTPS